MTVHEKDAKRKIDCFHYPPETCGWAKFSPSGDCEKCPDYHKGPCKQ